MAKIRVTKRFHFEMAHALPGYDGLCSNIHGHSYYLEMTVCGEPANVPGKSGDGMVIDFQCLKSLVKSTVTDKLDHSLMVRQSIEEVAKRAFEKVTERIYYVDFQPTTENIVLHIVDKIKPVLPEGITLHSVRLYETGTSYAEWYACDNP